MRGTVTLYRFKNYETSSFPVSERMVVTGRNGSGKTNLLEAVYTVVNAAYPSGRHVGEMVRDRNGEAFVRLSLEREGGMSPEFSVSFAAEHGRTVLRYQSALVTRGKYASLHGYRAVLFSPVEMNLLYLGPSLRRDFLDETLLLAHEPFARIRREYLAVLRSRNALLKRISEGEAKPRDLDAWDLLFVEKAREYMDLRFSLLAHFRDNIGRIGESVWREVSLGLSVTTKVSESDVAGSIREYLRSHREKDVLVGHTCIGPHLDDFHFSVETPAGPVHSDTYLSRGENKSILLALKILSVEYVERHAGARTILLLDDMASELDSEHCLRFLEAFSGRPFILTGHLIPEGILAYPGIQRIHLE